MNFTFICLNGFINFIGKKNFMPTKHCFYKGSTIEVLMKFEEVVSLI